MTFSTTHVGVTAVFQMTGVFGAGENFRNLEAAVGRCCSSVIGAVLLDMTHVTILDCLGIGELLQLRRRTAASGRAFGLVNLDARKKRLLEMADLFWMLSIPGSGEGIAAEPRGAALAANHFGASHRVR